MPKAAAECNSITKTIFSAVPVGLSISSGARLKSRAADATFERGCGQNSGLPAAPRSGRAKHG